MNHSDGLRIIAKRYMRLADSASDPAERVKYLDYAEAYYEFSEQVAQRERDHDRDLSEQAEQRETSKGA